MNKLNREYYDIIGKRIGYGDMITYPGRQGSNMWMNLGVVRYVKDDYIEVVKKSYLENKIKVVRVYRTDRVVVLTEDWSFFFTREELRKVGM